MKVLVVSEWHQGGTGVFYHNAFRELGCETHFFDYTKELREVSPIARNRYARGALRLFFAVGMNRGLLALARALQPDLIFVTKGPYLLPSYLHATRDATGAQLVNLNLDNPFYPMASTRWIRDAIPVYDCHFTWGRSLAHKLLDAGARRVEFLPFAYEPTVHAPLDGPGRGGDEIPDVVFVATWDRVRESWMETIADLNLGIWGDSWKEVRRGSPLAGRITARNIYGEELRRILGGAKIVLNLLREQNAGEYNQRTFEIPACGGFQLTMRTAGLKEFFEEDIEVACFADPEEMRRQVERYLRAPATRRRIARAGHERVAPHTYEQRARQVLATVSKIR